MSMYLGWVEQHAGDAEAWERALLEGLAELEGSEERAFKATITGYLAQCLCEQGRYDEAFDLCPVVRQTSPSDDLVNFIYADMIEGAVLVRRGRSEEGVALLSRAIDQAQNPKDFAKIPSLPLSRRRQKPSVPLDRHKHGGLACPYTPV